MNPKFIQKVFAERLEAKHCPGTLLYHLTVPPRKGTRVPHFIQWMWFCHVNWILIKWEMRQELRFKYYYFSASHRPESKKKLFRAVKGEDRVVGNTKDPKLNMVYPVFCSHQNMRVPPPGCSFNIIYSTRQLFTKHQLQPIITQLSFTEAD